MPHKPIPIVPQSIRVRILNRDYSLQVERQDEQRVRSIARYVDTKIRQFQRDHPDQADITGPVIVALGIAEELFAEREKKTDAETDLHADIGQLIASLDAVLGPGESPASEK